jgi:CubicO group peptidase (beta-lactamase class C family)
VLAALIMTAPAAAPNRHAAAQDSVAADARVAATARMLSAVVERERVAKGIPAISVALVRGTRVAWARGFGWADSATGVPAGAGTVYRVGSVSKLFTDIGIMQLVERRTLDLDAPITKYLPSFHPKNPFGGAITIRELTSHRAGLTREPPVGNYFDASSPSLAATVASLDSTTLVYAPGTHTKYSNAGIAVLGYVLEKTQRRSFYPYLRETLLQPMGLEASAFEPLPALGSRMAKGVMWTLDGRRFDAPTFQLGMGPCGSMYSTVTDLGRFLGILFAGGTTPEGTRVLARATLDSMWTPQFARGGETTGYGIGFGIGRLDGHRTIGHDGAIYGFATTVMGLPDDSLGVVVIASLDGANAVTDRIAQTALRAMLAGQSGGAISEAQATSDLPRERALGLMGRYVRGSSGMDLEEFEGRVYATPLLGGFRTELRHAPDANDDGRGLSLISDDVLEYGRTLNAIEGARLVAGRDTLARVPTPGSDVIPMTTPTPGAAAAEYASVIGEYGWDYNTLYIREKDGKLNALIEWFFEYPLERVSRDVYRFPK